MLKRNKRTFGTIGEKIAIEYLIDHNYKVITKNYRFSRLGEIDIVAMESEYLCFIEVKTRTSEAFGTPSEAVNYKKRQNIIKLAHIYMNQHKIKDMNIRFDVVEVLGAMSKEKFEVTTIRLIKNAFQA